MNKSIAFVYIGEPRFEKMGTHNHKYLYQKLNKENINYKVYNFTSTKRTHEFGGISQIMNFYNALDKTKEDIIVKMRTDIFMEELTMDQIVLDIKESLKNNLKIFGYKGKGGVGNISNENNINSPEKFLHDYIIIIHRNNVKIKEKDDILKIMTNKPKKYESGGHKTFPYMMKDKSNVNFRFGGMNLIREKIRLKNMNPEIIAFHFKKKIKNWQIRSTLLILFDIIKNKKHDNNLSVVINDLNNYSKYVGYDEAVKNILKLADKDKDIYSIRNEIIKYIKK